MQAGKNGRHGDACARVCSGIDVCCYSYGSRHLEEAHRDSCHVAAWHLTIGLRGRGNDARICGQRLLEQRELEQCSFWPDTHQNPAGLGSSKTAQAAAGGGRGGYQQQAAAALNRSPPARARSSSPKKGRSRSPTKAAKACSPSKAEFRKWAEKGMDPFVAGAAAGEGELVWDSKTRAWKRFQPVKVYLLNPRTLDPVLLSAILCPTAAARVDVEQTCRRLARAARWQAARHPHQAPAPSYEAAALACIRCDPGSTADSAPSGAFQRPTLHIRALLDACLQQHNALRLCARNPAN